LGAWAPVLLDARAVTDLGYQLSVAGIAALIASERLARRLLARPGVAARVGGGWRAQGVRALLASSVATAASAPLVAWHFGRISIVAPLTNLAAAPVVAVLQPALFLALLLAPVMSLASFVADAAHPMLLLFDAAATAGAAVPHGALSVSPTLATAVLAGVASAALLLACVSRHTGRPLALALAATAAALWLPLLPGGRREVELHMMDVGQGDALALRTPAGRWILFDAGRASRGGSDDGRRVVIPYLRRRGGDVAAFVLSHPHLDHVGGAASVVRSLRPRTFWDGAYVGTSESYRAALAEAVRQRIAWRRVRPGDSVSVDGVVLRFLAPDSAWMQSLDDANEASVVALARYGAVRFLLVGDAERGEEAWLLAHARDELRAEVLKVGHHGSMTSTSPGFLEAVRPRVALVSVGPGNSYGHPSAAVLGSLVEAGAAVLRTDHLGSVVVRTDGRRLRVEVEGEEWEPSARSATP
ncbi:MAG TPA: ComEC/Rec2 family competence protein, partial [Gemmatimonadaceae bacterium]|nr:ComEC/Rec2 family competence protein [Gemmatimonadaceae bacterium]